MHVPFYLGAAAVLLSIGVLATGHSLLVRAELGDEQPTVVPDAAEATSEILLPAENG